ncbi:alanine/glycine:cation symporter family protein [Hirschia baltica]|uniref:Amino acid carrier protein n=1 Tax=Hirschia baltica (strain ATCC 49814 / DSM 5838 / IFAM 1418) TaxID=582402 RepID=C6XR46_HIRBI|nr:sodium:alanine symporter family protein [Hirschia baltica]ACT60577.1 amino acid carrier protein [Hirschia baltica ATCC 49814]
METLVGLIDNVSNFIWGGTWGDQRILPVGLLAVFLVGTGIYMMIRLGGRPLTRFIPALKEVWDGRKAQGEEGAITPWQALSTALSGQVGTGNLAGVATALALGGPGAIFWMWVTAILGMALAFSESSLAIKYREWDEYDRVNGGPMYYIKNGLSKNWGWLAVLFCIGTLASAMATGSMIQANSITEAAKEVAASSFNFHLPGWAVGAVIAALVFAVIVGGIKSIGSVAGKVVPVMAGLYVVIAFVVLMMNITKVPGAFADIFTYAFGFKQAVGGAAGYGVMQAVRFGIARGLFSNEAGQGSAPIAHAAAQTKNPVQQGEIAMIGVFIDTMVICTMTALVILTVQGDFRRNSATIAADACFAADLISIPAHPIEGESYSKGDLFPTATQIGRNSLLAHNGAVAQELLLSCQEADASLVSDEAIKASYPDVFRSISGDQYDILIAAQSDSETDPTLLEATIERLADIEAQADSTLTKVKHAWESDADSAAITTRAYGAAFPGGEWVVPIALFFFAFTTIIGWSYYGEQALTYLVGEWATHPFRFAWVAVVFAGSLVTNTDSLWRLGDIANATMAIPNLIAIIALSGVVIAMHKKNGDPDAPEISEEDKSV